MLYLVGSSISLPPKACIPLFCWSLLFFHLVRVMQTKLFSCWNSSWSEYAEYVIENWKFYRCMKYEEINTRFDFDCSDICNYYYRFHEAIQWRVMTTKNVLGKNPANAYELLSIWRMNDVKMCAFDVKYNVHISQNTEVSTMKFELNPTPSRWWTNAAATYCIIIFMKLGEIGRLIIWYIFV